MKIVIRAGGIGSRLWPYSREGKPKQFHAFVGEETLIQQALRRLKPIASPKDTFVSTHSRYATLVLEQLPELTLHQLIVEPDRRNTAAAVCLESVYIYSLDQEAVIASLGSDHYIGRPDEFCRLLKVAEKAVLKMPDYLFTMGVKPTRVETGYGHIKKGGVINEIEGEKIYRVDQFTEKPPYPKAREYTESGLYLWNANVFVWKASTILELFRKHEPEMYEALMGIGKTLGTPEGDRLLAYEYPKLKNVAVDYAIIEKAEKVAVIGADVGWEDIGSWAGLGEVLTGDGDNNLIHGNVIALDTKNTTIYGGHDKIVAAIGLDNVVIVDTGDALLVCTKDKAQQVKEIVDRLSKDEGLKGYI